MQVVWNPWVEKAKEFADLPDEAYSDFVCAEANPSIDLPCLTHNGECWIHIERC